MIGSIIGDLCEMLTGHRMGPWTQIGETGIDNRFNRAQCRWCRQWYVRPRPLAPIDWSLYLGPPAPDPWRLADRR